MSLGTFRYLCATGVLMSATSDSGGRFSQPLVSLGAAIVLSALGTPVLKKLVQLGGHFGEVLENAISYCNILFVGNLCSAAILFAIYRPRRFWHSLSRASAICWLAMLGNLVFANVLAPGLVIQALEETEITVVILLLPTDAIFIAIFSALFFGERPSRRAVLGLGMIGTGALVLASLQDMGTIGLGFVLALSAAFCRSLGTAMARSILTDQELMPVFLIVRNLIGAIVFYILAVWMFGPGHFADAFSPALWPLMLVYAGLVVVLGQLSWYHAVANLPGPVVSKWTTLVPVASMLFAYMLLGTLPSPSQGISGMLVFLGLGVMQWPGSGAESTAQGNAASTHLQPERPLTGS